MKPILFSTPMVQAILNGEKTMTRRAIKNIDPLSKYLPEYTIAGFIFIEPSEFEKPDDLKIASVLNCPYGQVGDVLWVRETFREIQQDSGGPRYEYKATETINLTDKWKPSIFMPKAACRIFLKITNIRVEKLHDITGSDAMKEGVRIPVNGKNVIVNITDKYKAIDFMPHGVLTKQFKPTQTEWLKAFFFELWCKINGKESYQQNPWLWVISFERTENPV